VHLSHTVNSFIGRVCRIWVLDLVFVFPTGYSIGSICTVAIKYPHNENQNMVISSPDSFSDNV
jgi:hypothetical protein